MKPTHNAAAQEHKSETPPLTVYKRPKDDNETLSNTKSITKPSEPDLTLFENMNITDYCNATNSQISDQIDVEFINKLHCPATKRIVAVLNHYHILTMTDVLDENMESEFIEFCDTNYGEKWMLEDYIHCIQVTIP